MNYQVNRTLYGTLLLLVLAPMLSACGEDRLTSKIKLGAPFPVAKVDRLDGTSVALDTLRGKVVIFHLWASWCAPCRKEMPDIEKLLKRLNPEHFAFIALSVDDDLNLLEEFKLKYAVTFADYIDADRSIAEGMLAVTSYPDTFIIGTNGHLIQQLQGEQKWDSLEMVSFLENLYQQNHSGVVL